MWNYIVERKIIIFMDKRYCDICGKCVSAYDRFENIILDTQSGARLRYGVCISCYSKIKRYIWAMRKAFEEDRNESMDSTK